MWRAWKHTNVGVSTAFTSGSVRSDSRDKRDSPGLGCTSAVPCLSVLTLKKGKEGLKRDWQSLDEKKLCIRFNPGSAGVFVAAQFAKGNLRPKAPGNSDLSIPQTAPPWHGHLTSSMTSPPPASNVGAALTGASDILRVDGGLGRLEGAGAENVVSAQGHGVHPVSVALQGAAQDPLGTKPPSDRDRTQPGCTAPTTPTRLQGPTPNFPNLLVPAAGRLSRGDTTLLRFRNQFPLHNAHQLRLLQGCFQLLAHLMLLWIKTSHNSYPLQMVPSNRARRCSSSVFQGTSCARKSRQSYPPVCPAPFASSPRAVPHLHPGSSRL